MIFEETVGNLSDLPEADYDIEVIEIPYDDLNKDILRVTSDKGNEYGISIDHHQHPLKNGDILQKDGNHLLVIQVLPQEMIIITPKDINEMGVIAHMLGNTHKPIAVENGKIMLEVDPVVQKILDDRGIQYAIESVVLDEPLNYVNLSHHHHHDD